MGFLKKDVPQKLKILGEDRLIKVSEERLQDSEGPKLALNSGVVRGVVKADLKSSNY